MKNTTNTTLRTKIASHFFWLRIAAQGFLPFLGLRPNTVLPRWCLLLFVSLMAPLASQAVSLQGQDKGDTNTWKSVNLQDWQELDFIRFRLLFNAGSAGSQNITLEFPHLSGTTPGFEDLTGFAPSTNAVITSGPTLTTDSSGTWTYTFSVNITNSSAAEVRFFARLAAGAHLNPGSSLHLDGSGGNVQIHKPSEGPRVPDLAVVKTG